MKARISARRLSVKSSIDPSRVIYACTDGADGIGVGSMEFDPRAGYAVGH
jgi:hypothetical protein